MFFYALIHHFYGFKYYPNKDAIPIITIMATDVHYITFLYIYTYISAYIHLHNIYLYIHIHTDTYVYPYNTYIHYRHTYICTYKIINWYVFFMFFIYFVG